MDAEFHSLKAKADETRNRGQRLADRMTSAFGSTAFLVINTVAFIVWIAWNAAGGHVFDAYPFNMLTMMVSLEAIFLSIFVLIAQNRSAAVDELRAELDLRINLISEKELTKVLQLVARIAEKQGIDVASDRDLRGMLEPTNHVQIERELETQLDPHTNVARTP
jgi:uncharacterized membrane protein